jgi:hypothetical protein
MARTRRGPHTQAIAYVAGRTKPTAGLAQLSASPTGHPPMSPTGHQSCRGTVGRMRRGGDWRDRNEVLTYRPSRSRHGPHMTEYTIVPDGSKGFGVELISPTRFLSVRGFATELDAQVWTDAQEASEAVAKEGDEVGPARGKVIPSAHGKAHPRSIARARVSNSSA